MSPIRELPTPRTPSPQAGAPPWWILLLPLVAAALLRDLWAPDEPRRAQVALEMWHSGNPWVLRLCGDLYPDKPPLLFWILAPLGALSGWNAAALRLVSLASTAGTAWLVARLARARLVTAAAGWAPCLFLGFALITHEGGRLNIDPLLTLLCTAALAATLMGPEVQWKRAALVGLLTGLAALAKGPVAFTNVGLVLLAWWWTGGRPRLSIASLAIGGFLAVAPILGWAGTVAWLEPEVARQLFFDQHVGRVLRAEDHAGPVWKNLIRVPLLLLPWTPFVIAGLWLAGKHRLGSLREPALWLAVHLLFFSLIPVKRDLYLLPMYPAAALLGAAALAHYTARETRAPWLRGPGTWLLLAVGAGLLGAAPFAHRLEERVALGLPAAMVGLVLLGGSWFARRAPSMDLWARRMLGTWAVGMSVLGLVLLPALDPLKSARSLGEVLAARPERPERIPCLGVHPEAYRFYGGAPTVRDDDLVSALEREGAEFLALVREEEWRAFPEATRSRFEVLYRGSVGSKDILVLGARKTARNQASRTSSQNERVR